MARGRASAGGVRSRRAAAGAGSGPAAAGSRPASASARRSRNSICALALRSSSAAQRASASWTAGSSRSSTCLRLRCGPAAVRLGRPSLVEGARVEDRLGGAVTAQHHQQIATPSPPSAPRPARRCPARRSGSAPTRPCRPRRPRSACRAATTAPACCRWSIAEAISGAYARWVKRDSMICTPAASTRAASSTDELLGDLLGVAAQRQAVLVVGVVGVLDRDVPHGGLGLGARRTPGSRPPRRPPARCPRPARRRPPPARSGCRRRR